MGFNWRQWLPPLSSHGFQAETVGEQSHQGLPPPSRAPSLFWSDLAYATRPSTSRSELCLVLVPSPGYDSQVTLETVAGERERACCI